MLPQRTKHLQTILDGVRYESLAEERGIICAARRSPHGGVANPKKETAGFQLGKVKKASRVNGREGGKQERTARRHN